MTTYNDVRKAHKVLNSLFKGETVLEGEREFLTKFLPELPKQKTLAEIIAHVDDAWAGASDNYWGGNSYSSEITIEDWLAELREQLEGLAEETSKDPELPAGMRLANHMDFGRVVDTGWIDSYGEHFCVFYSDVLERGSYVFLPENSLTFIDSKPAHPEFLETEADYQNAPAGTVAAKDGWLAWIKQKNVDWSCDGGSEEGSILAQTGKRRVLRWGWGNE